MFNLGAADWLSLKELAEMLVELHAGGEYRLVPFPGERQRIDIGSYYADFGRIAARLGWRPRVNLREGLARTLAFYAENAGHYWERSNNAAA